MSSEWSPIDEREVALEGRMHHGLLYQHVAAAHAIVNMVRGRLSANKIVVEKDQDIEIELPDRYVYLQVKARPDIVFSQLEGALIRFHRVRLTHDSGTRKGAYAFGFLLGGSLGPELEERDGSYRDALQSKIKRLATKHQLDPAALVTTWHMISWYLPGAVVADLGGASVHGSADLALASLIRDVAEVPRLANSTVTTAYALVTAMQALAADSLDGFLGRSVESNQLGSLIERVGRTVEQIPPLPQYFVPLSVLPNSLPDRVTCFLGTPGSGKTTHLSWLALREPYVVYLRPSTSRAEPLIDQLVGQLRAALEAIGVPAGELGPPPAAAISGVERVTALCSAVPPSTLVIIDDCHLLDSSVDLRLLLAEVTRRARVALCGQPGRPDGIGTSIGIRTLFESPPAVIDVQGWSTDDVSHYLQKRGRPSDPVTAQSLRAITGGHPLGTSDLVDIAVADFGGDLEAAVRAIHTGDIASTLKAVTAAHFRMLPVSAKRAAAVIAAIEFAPTRDELRQILPLDEARSGLEHLFEHRYLISLPRGGASERLNLHDAYHHEVRLHFTELFTAEERRRLHAAAARILEARLARTGSAWLLPPLFLNQAFGGALEGVIDQLTDGKERSAENLQRLGVGAPLSEVLDQLIAFAPTPQQRYWLRDALIFLNEADELHIDSGSLWARQLSDYASIKGPDQILRLAHEHKAMRLAGQRDLSEARRHYEQARSVAHTELRRAILDHEFASILLGHRQLAAALVLLRENVVAYIKWSGIHPTRFWTMPPRELISHLGHAMSRENVMRLADSLESAAMCLERMGDLPVDIYARARLIYDVLGATKAELRARVLLGRQCARAPKFRDRGLELLEEALRWVQQTNTYGAIILCTTVLAATYELRGDTSRRDELLQTLRTYNPREIEEELEAHRLHLGMPVANPIPSARTYLFMFADGIPLPDEDDELEEDELFDA